MGSLLGCVVISESNIGAVEYLGKYDRMLQSGCHCINCILESVPHQVSLKVQTFNIQVETVTNESLSVIITVGVQYKINNENIAYANNNCKGLAQDRDLELDEKSELISKKSYQRYDVSYQARDQINSMYDNPVYKAIYTTTDPLGQMRQFINAYFRTIGSNHTMKELFTSKDKLSNALTDILNGEMNKYGYSIITALIADIDPPQTVKNTMNLVLSSQNERDAMINKAEASKQASILKAEGECRIRELEGKGLALQRQALVDGLKQSVNGLSGGQVQMDPNQLTSTIITMQYIDMLNTAASRSNHTLILPSTPNSATNFEEQVRNALLSVREIKNS